MKPMTKAQTIRHLKSAIRSLDYYLSYYVIPYQDQVQKIILEEQGYMSSGCSGWFQSDETSMEYLKANLQDCLKTVKKLKVR